MARGPESMAPLGPRTLATSLCGNPSPHGLNGMEWNGMSCLYHCWILLGCSGLSCQDIYIGDVGPTFGTA